MNLTYFTIVVPILMCIYEFINYIVIPFINLILIIFSPDYFGVFNQHVPGVSVFTFPMRVINAIGANFLYIAVIIIFVVFKVIYGSYFASKYIYIDEPGLGGTIARFILNLLDPFVKIGLFPVLDYVFIPLFKIKTKSGGVVIIFAEALKNFISNIVAAARQGPFSTSEKSASLSKKEEDSYVTTLTEEEKEKYKECLKEKSVPIRDTGSSMQLLQDQLTNNRAELLCKLQKYIIFDK